MKYLPIKELLQGRKKNDVVNDEELLELSDENEYKSGINKVPITVIELKSYEDAEDVQRALREGKIIFVKIKTLKDKEMNELKRAIERIRKTCTATEGDIAGVDENYIIVAPSYAKIMKDQIDME